jgi:hypothetical protein
MRITIRLTLLLPFLALSWNSILSQTPTDARSELRSGWKRVGAEGGFSFQLPKDMKEKKVQAIDSYVAQYENDSLRIFLDYGMYSNPLDKLSNESEYIEIKRTIAGLDATEVFFRQTSRTAAHRYFAAIHFPNVGGNRDTGTTKLTMTAEFNKKGDWGAAQTIFESIRLR